MGDQRKTGMHRKRSLGTLDPLSTFAHLQMMPCESFFIQSSATIGTGPDTTVIGVGPFEVLRDLGGKTEMIVNGHSEIVEKPFFKVLEGRLQALREQGDTETPFQNGGIFGCVGYDCIAEIEPKLKKTGYFKSENMKSLAQVMVAHQLIVFDHKEEMVHLIASCSANAICDIDTLERVLAEAPVLRSDLSVSKAKELNTHRLVPLLGLDEFKKHVFVIKEHIRNGDIFQAVLAERFACQTPAQPFEIFKMLRRASPAPYSFYFNLGSKTFFGASPEALVRVNGRNVSTNPIAGTRPRGQTRAQDRLFQRQLTRSPKEAAEHLMLVDLARNDLGRVAKPGSVSVKSFREVYRFSNVMHLVSEVGATLKDGITALDAFKACFPAGTLSGAPKIRAMEILSELEPQPRGYYGGAIVAFDSVGGLDSCIAIRSLEMQNQVAVLRAGAGIVADSRAESEYAEILSKTKLLRIAIAAAEHDLIERTEFYQGVVS